MLIITDKGLGYTFHCDASKEGLGGALMQLGKVVAYVFQQLKEHERNYPTHNLKLIAVVFTFKCWRYFYGEKFEIFSNIKSLIYIFMQKGLNLRQRYWMEYMEDYNFMLEYHSSKANVVVDALSCRSHTILACVVINEWEMLDYISEFVMLLGDRGDNGLTLFLLGTQPKLYCQITKAQQGDHVHGLQEETTQRISNC